MLPNGATEIGTWSFAGKGVFGTFSNTSFPLAVPISQGTWAVTASE